LSRTRIDRRTVKRGAIKPPSIRLGGPIDGALLRRVVPEIRAHRRRSPQEIMVYIDSGGGLVDAAELIWQELSEPGRAPRRPAIVGVSRSRAFSIAAHLLARSDYAVVSRRTLLHFHGTWTGAPSISASAAASTSHDLYREDDRLALRLAPAVLRRLLDTYRTHRESIERIRARAPEEAAFLWGLGVKDEPDIACLVQLLLRRVGKASSVVTTRAFDEFQRILVLRVALRRRFLGFLPARLSKHLRGTAPRRREAIELRVRTLLALIEEKLIVEGRRTDFSPAGVYDLALELDFVTEVADPYFQDEVLGVLVEHADQFLSERDLALLLAAKGNTRENRTRLDRIFRRAYARLYPAWLFARILCRCLARGEHRIPAVDAWWLGLVDEVEGTPLCRRLD